MKRFFICIWGCMICLAINAQLNKEATAAYIADVRQYESAIADIVKKGNVRQGIATLSSLIEQSEKKADYPLQELASYYSARAQGWQKLKQYQQAETDCRHALTLLQKAGEAGKADMNMAWYQLALACYYMGKPKEAMQAADNCIQTAISYYGPLHTETRDAYNLRSNMAGFYDKKQIALNDRTEIFRIIQKNIERNFVYLTASERTSYWSKQQPETTIMFAFAHKMNERESAFTDELFNQQLLAKGLLLTAESALQRAIDNDPALNTAYQDIRRLRQIAANDKTSPKDADVATLEADRLERQLGTSANAIHKYLDFLKVHVEDVRLKVAPEDVVVEFVDYRVGKDSTMYAALVLSPRWKHVRFIPLAEAKEIEAHADNLAPYVWQPVIDAVGYTPKSIYFAPSGLLYQYPIESHVLADGRLVCEAFNIYRMSSSRWLAYNDNDAPGRDAVVYGGLAYDANVVDPVSAKERGAENGLPYLAGTKEEAEKIAKTINVARKAGLHAEALLGEQGTETSFKALSGQRKRIVHIATHGFYQADKQPAASASDNALTRSGLFFAGADNSWLDGHIARNADDGVLTALEISNLDLRGLELATLSACETGQGDISGDGVFGLQRGFKKSGAKSILMSLWKVDDNATSLLMTEFYNNWISRGKTKHDALEQAKQTVRSHNEKGWDAPKYWAAFILLDAME